MKNDMSTEVNLSCMLNDSFRGVRGSEVFKIRNSRDKKGEYYE